MTPSIFVDSDAFVALVNASDNSHLKALKISQKLERLRTKFFTSPLIVEEFVSVLTIKYGLKEEAIKFAREIINDVNFVSVDFDDLQNALTILEKQKSKNISLQDCLNIHFVNKHSFDAIFSFDKIYGKNNLTYASDLDLN